MMMVFTYDYNRSYNPSAPFVDIILNNEREDANPIPLSAQIDSGADSSLVPKYLLEEVGATVEDQQMMITADGFRQRVSLYGVSIKLAGRTFYPTVVAVARGEEVIIGRDILNRLVVTLDGYATTTRIEGE